MSQENGPKNPSKEEQELRSDLAQNISSIIMNSEKGSAGSVTVNRIYDTVSKRIRQGDIEGAQVLITSSYFNEAELKAATEAFDTYKTLKGEQTTPVSHKEDAEKGGGGGSGKGDGDLKIKSGPIAKPEDAYTKTLVTYLINNKHYTKETIAKMSAEEVEEAALQAYARVYLKNTGEFSDKKIKALLASKNGDENVLVQEASKHINKENRDKKSTEKGEPEEDEVANKKLLKELLGADAEHANVSSTLALVPGQGVLHHEVSLKDMSAEELTRLKELAQVEKKAATKGKVAATVATVDAKPAPETREPGPSTTRKILDKLVTAEDLKKFNAILDNPDIPIVIHGEQIRRNAKRRFESDENPDDIYAATDIDAKMATYILTVLGKAESKVVHYIPKGSQSEKGIHLDVGSSPELFTVGADKARIDHHHPQKWFDTSGAELTLELLNKAGRIEKIEPWMREAVKFVTEIDNMSYPRKDENWLRNVYPSSLLGLRDSMPFDMMIDFFKNGKKPYEGFTDEELTMKIPGEESKTIMDLVIEAQRDTVRSINYVKHHADKETFLGTRSNTLDLGRTLFCKQQSVGGKSASKNFEIPIKAHAVYNMGFDSWVKWNGKGRGYFISKFGDNLNFLYNRIKNIDTNAILVRGSMILRIQRPGEAEPAKKMDEWQFKRLAGLTIASTEKMPTQVEYNLLRLRKQADNKFSNYSEKLNWVEFECTKARSESSKTYLEIEAKRNELKSRGASEKFITYLENKLAALAAEDRLWSQKIQLIETLRTGPESQWQTLINKDLLSPNDVSNPDSETDNEADAIAGGEREEENVQNEIVASGVVENTQEAREAQIQELHAEYLEIEARFKNFKDGTIEEYRELTTKRYNNWALGKFLSEGGEGTPPKVLNYKQILPLMYGPGKASAPKAPAPIVPEAVIAPTVESKEKAPQIDWQFVDGAIALLPENLRNEMATKIKTGGTQEEYDKWVIDMRAHIEAKNTPAKELPKEESNDVTWSSLIQPGKEIMYDGRKVHIESVEHVGKDRENGGYFRIITKEGGRIEVSYNETEDSYLLYQNGKKTPTVETSGEIKNDITDDDLIETYIKDSRLTPFGIQNARENRQETIESAKYSIKRALEFAAGTITAKEYLLAYELVGGQPFGMNEDYVPGMSQENAQQKAEETSKKWIELANSKQ